MSHSPRVFVVDDDPSMRKSVQRLLEVRDFDVETFESAEDLLNRADFMSAICAVVDIHLQGMSGIDLCSRLGKEKQSCPVICITANDDEPTRKAALNAGCVAYITKPFAAVELVAAIQKCSRYDRL